MKSTVTASSRDPLSERRVRENSGTSLYSQRIDDIFREVDEALGIINNPHEIEPDRDDILSDLQQYRKSNKLLVKKSALLGDREGQRKTKTEQEKEDWTTIEKRQQGHIRNSMNAYDIGNNHRRQERRGVLSPELKIVSPDSITCTSSHEHNIIRGRGTTSFSIYDASKPREVSPEDKHHRSTVLSVDERDKLVYVAGSMRGDCFHFTSSCYGLRSSRRGSNGITTITKEGAGMRNMRPCQLCKPSSVASPDPSGLHLVQHEGSACRGNNQLVPTPHQLIRNTDTTVFIAASLKGQCYHLHSGCKGLRDANGVTSIPLLNVNTMRMRPCRLCRPTERAVSHHIYSLSASSESIITSWDCNENSQSQKCRCRLGWKEVLGNSFWPMLS